MIKELLISTCMITAVFATDKDFESKEIQLRAMVYAHQERIERKLSKQLIPFVHRNHAGKPDVILRLSQQYFNDMYFPEKSYKDSVIQDWRVKGQITEELANHLTAIECPIVPNYHLVKGNLVKNNKKERKVNMRTAYLALQNLEDSIGPDVYNACADLSLFAEKHATEEGGILLPKQLSVGLAALALNTLVSLSALESETKDLPSKDFKKGINALDDFKRNMEKTHEILLQSIETTKEMLSQQIKEN